jgi:uncharacterized protein YhhL (DUF1145 family)
MTWCAPNRVVTSSTTLSRVHSSVSVKTCSRYPFAHALSHSCSIAQSDGPLARFVLFAPYLPVGGIVFLLLFAWHPHARGLHWLLIIVTIVVLICFAVPIILNHNTKRETAYMGSHSID